MPRPLRFVRLRRHSVSASGTGVQPAASSTLLAGNRVLAMAEPQYAPQLANPFLDPGAAPVPTLNFQGARGAPPAPRPCLKRGRVADHNLAQGYQAGGGPIGPNTSSGPFRVAVAGRTPLTEPLARRQPSHNRRGLVTVYPTRRRRCNPRPRSLPCPPHRRPQLPRPAVAGFR